MSFKTLNDLFIHELSDIHNAEKQLTKVLPKMARAAGAIELSAVFQRRLDKTQDQIARIEQIAAMCGLKLKRMKCAAMEGLIAEGEALIDDSDRGPVRDAALIGAAQKVEHYEIASYGTLAAFARHLGYDEAVTLLQESLDEKKAADRKLTALAERKANFEAEVMPA